MKIAYLLDSGSSFEITNRDNCFLTPMIIDVIESNGTQKSYLDVIDLNNSQLQEILKSKKTLKTSQPIIGQIYKKVDELLNEYDKVVFIPFSEFLSSTYQTFLLIKNEYNANKILIANANTISNTGNWLIDDIENFVKQNGDINQNQLDDICNKNKNNQCGALIISDPSYLIAGGRLKGLKGLIVKTLKLKLIIKYKGKLDFANKAMNFYDAIDKSLQIIDKDCEFSKYGIKRCIIFTSLENEQDSNEYINYLNEKLNLNNNYVKAYLPGCVQCHTGPNNFAIIIESNR